MAEKEKSRKSSGLTERVMHTGWTYIRHVVDTAREPFLILDDALIVMAANEAFYRKFDVTKAETEERYVYEIGNGQWASTHLRKLLEEILPEETFFRDFEVDHVFPIVGHKIILLNARRVFEGPEGAPKLIILAMEDVTKQRLIEAKLSDYAKELEKKVSERTEELTRRIEQLELVNKLTIDREIKMIELKQEIEELKKRLDAR